MTHFPSSSLRPFRTPPPPVRFGQVAGSGPKRYSPPTPPPGIKPKTAATSASRPPTSPVGNFLGGTFGRWLTTALGLAGAVLVPTGGYVYRKSIVNAVTHLTATAPLPHLPQGAASPSPAKQVAEAAKSAWSATQKLAAAGVSLLGMVGLSVLALKGQNPVQPQEEPNPNDRERREAFLNARQQRTRKDSTGSTNSINSINGEPSRLTEQFRALNGLPNAEAQDNIENQNNLAGTSNLAIIRNQQEQEALNMTNDRLLLRYRNALAVSELVQKKAVRALIEQAQQSTIEQGDSVDAKIAAAKVLLENPNAQALLTEVSFRKLKGKEEYRIRYKFSEDKNINYDITLGNVQDYNTVRSMYSDDEAPMQRRIVDAANYNPIPFELQKDFEHILSRPSGPGTRDPEKFERNNI